MLSYAIDGKIYTINTEHTPTQPITRGWQLHCINATTGEGIFKTMMTGSMGAIADGYMAISESYTGTMYVLGKGKSQTTVTAPDVAVPQGSSVVIKGTVLDLSPAQPNTPCVSKDSMATQMEYLHKQLPIGGLWGNETITGVPVILTAIDPNGNSVNIGTATTNGYYGTFSFTWTPNIAGEYEILANFAGDESYGSSGASTAVVISEAAAQTPSPSTSALTMPPIELYTIGSAAAVIIAVAIATVLILRKRP